MIQRVVHTAERPNALVINHAVQIIQSKQRMVRVLSPGMDD